MKKSIVVKKSKPICKLEGLTGVKKHKIDAYWFEMTDIPMLRKYFDL